MEWTSDFAVKSEGSAIQAADEAGQIQKVFLRINAKGQPLKKCFSFFLFFFSTPRISI